MPSLVLAGQSDCRWCDDGKPAQYVASDARCKPINEVCAPLPPSPPSPPPRSIGDTTPSGCTLLAGTDHTGTTCKGSTKVFEGAVVKWHLTEEWCYTACQRDSRCSVARYSPTQTSYGMNAPYCAHYKSEVECDLQPESSPLSIVFKCPAPAAVDCSSLVADGLPCGQAAGGAVCANCCGTDGLCGSGTWTCNRQHGAHPLYSASGFADIGYNGVRVDFGDVPCAPSPPPALPPALPPVSPTLAASTLVSSPTSAPSTYLGRVGAPIDCLSLKEDGAQCGTSNATSNATICRHCCSSTGFCGNGDLWCGAGNQPGLSYAKIDPSGALCAPPPSPPLLPPPRVSQQPAQCVTMSDGSTRCVSVPVTASLNGNDLRERVRLHFGSALR